MLKNKSSNIETPNVLSFNESLPPFVRLILDGTKTALLVLDTSEKGRGRKSFVESIPKIKKLIEKARNAKAQVIYTITMKLGPDVVAEIKPDLGNDYLLETYGADKFYKTKLEEILFRQEIKNVVLVGTAANGAVLYTAFEAILRGFTVVVVADCVSADTDEVHRFTLWQILNAPGRSNSKNTPLAPFAATLTTEGALTFK